MKFAIKALVISLFIAAQGAQIANAAMKSECGNVLFGMVPTPLATIRIPREASEAFADHSIYTLSEVGALTQDEVFEILSGLSVKTIRQSIYALMKAMREASEKHLDGVDEALSAALIETEAELLELDLQMVLSPESTGSATSLSDLGLPLRHLNFLLSQGYYFLGDLAKETFERMVKVAGLKRAFIFEELLFEHGLNYRGRVVQNQLPPDSPISKLNLDEKLELRLVESGFSTIEDLNNSFTVEDALKGNVRFEGLGPKSLIKIQAALIANGSRPLKVRSVRRGHRLDGLWPRSS